MKILQINATYGIGSTGIISKEISDICLQNNIETYMAFSKGFGVVDEMQNFYEIGSWLDHKIHAFCSKVTGRQAYYSKRATRKLIDYMASISPDVVHLHNLHSNYIHLETLLTYLSVKNIPTVISLHDCWFYTGGCFHYTLVGCEKWKHNCGNCIIRDKNKFWYDDSSQILSDRVRYFSKIKNLTLVGVSSWITEQIKESRLRDIARIECIYNGFDTDVFKCRGQELKEKLGLKGKFIILGPASKWLQSANKSTFDYFVQMMPSDTILLLFGYNGSKITLPNNVKLYDFTSSRDEMAELYSIADVMVNCSREDTLSSLNIEAQACGTPVVTYDSTGSKETVNGVCGFAVKSGNYEDLFNNVERIKSIGKSSVSDICRDFVVANFEKYNNYSKYINLYKRITQ